MGLLRTDIELVNTYDFLQHRRKKLAAKDVHRLTVQALVDTGAIMLFGDMDLIVDLNEQTLKIHPDHPYKAQMVLKGAR
jgi:hypothetical protein